MELKLVFIYPIALTKLKAYEYLNQSCEEFFANKNDTSLLSLPIGEHITLDQVDEITKIIKLFSDINN